ncbi:hypothetical protein [Thaumasiovibrio subtropicus]|uniref:hypothetical protein n=1 Tax=Thaumasiovibrio subtropicus TaxID=1891207 RepID=UPI000B3586CF|nr:hypothetical protein [Thaumasiovibrio subtropicus]
MKKRVLAAAVALMVSAPTAWANYGFDAGIYLGSPSSGLTIKPHPLFKFSLGLDTFSFSGDIIMNLSEALGQPQLEALYAYGGIQYTDDDEHRLGPRFGVGFEFPLGMTDLMTFYAEAGPTWYLDKESTMRLEGQAGVRFKF